MDEIVKMIKGYRVDLDKQFKVMGAMPRSREFSLAITRTEDAKMWLGQVLKRIGTENPYPDSKNAANTKIAPTADVWTGDVEKAMEGIGHIQKVKQMRSELTSVYEDIEKNQWDFNRELNILGYHSLTKSWEYIIEANMWLGMELGRIKREENSEE